MTRSRVYQLQPGGLEQQLNEVLTDISYRLSAIEGQDTSMQTDGNVYTTRDPAPWDDLRFPAQGLNPPGAGTDPAVDSADGTLLFSHINTNIIGGIAQMPHRWKEGSTLGPHIHWAKTSTGSGDAWWEHRYRVLRIGRVFGAWNDWTSALLRTSQGLNVHSLSAFPDILMAGEKVSVCVQWQVRRAPGDSRDTYGASARLLEYDIHYQSDTAFGSDGEFQR